MRNSVEGNGPVNHFLLMLAMNIDVQFQIHFQSTPIYSLSRNRFREGAHLVDATSDTARTSPRSKNRASQFSFSKRQFQTSNVRYGPNGLPYVPSHNRFRQGQLQIFSIPPIPMQYYYICVLNIQANDALHSRSSIGGFGKSSYSTRGSSYPSSNYPSNSPFQVR